MEYGKKIREIRTLRSISLRKLANESDIDVAYLSRVERGTINPPQKPELLESINLALALDEEQAQKLRDLASIDNSKIPDDMVKDTVQVVGFPMLLRTIANKKLSAEKLKEVTDYINKQY